MHPFSLTTLPNHRALTLTPAERAALPKLEILRDVPGAGFLTLRSDIDGEWTLFPERTDRDRDPTVELRYRLPGVPMLDRGKDDGLDPVESMRRFSQFGGNELGRVWSQAKAIELIELARRTSFEGSPEEQLARAGFTRPSEEGPVYDKRAPGGHYSISLNPTGVWLRYEPSRKNYWHNLLILHTASEWGNGREEPERFSPLFWPPTMEDPLRALTGLAVAMTEIWTPELLRKPKPKARGPKA